MLLAGTALVSATAPRPTARAVPDLARRRVDATRRVDIDDAGLLALVRRVAQGS